MSQSESIVTEETAKKGAVGLTILWLFFVLCLIVAASLVVDVSAQFWLAGSLVTFLVLSRKKCEHGFLRIVYLGVIGFLSVRYISWRTVDTLSWGSPFDFIPMILLYLAEFYAVVLGLLGMFVCIEPINRPTVPMNTDPEKLPSVDIFITTYNEPYEMIEVTLQAARQVRYPEGYVSIYLLDDGGTQDKLESKDPEIAITARIRSMSMKKLCQRLKVGYLSRENNDDHKAGNINAALTRTNGDLVVILDADHVPTTDFLEKTVGHFEHDPKLFLVQTPHFFINPDPIEKNLEVFTRMPSENEVFYRMMQKGLDYWNGSLFAGSAAVLRRTCLDEINGFSTTSVTEDAETALDLHSKGFNSLYVSDPLISGLATESFSAFITQRLRWGTGMVQIMMLKNPVFRPGLTFSQRICYLSNCLYWFFPFARVIFFVAPMMYLLFGLHIYNANTTEILAYTLPHYWASLQLSSFLFRRVRWPFVSLLYETLQSLFSLQGLIKTISNPRAPKFVVTPKGMHLDKDFISPLATPFYIFFVLQIIAFAFGVYRFINFPEEQTLVLLVGFWHVINLLLMLASFGVLAELRQRRAMPRVASTETAILKVHESRIPCTIDNLSTGGVSIFTNNLINRMLIKGTNGILEVENKALNKTSSLVVEIKSVTKEDNGRHLGLEFVSSSANQRAEIVGLVHGDSQRWSDYWDDRPQEVGKLEGIFLLVYWGMKHSKMHLKHLLNNIWRLIQKIFISPVLKQNEV